LFDTKNNVIILIIGDSMKRIKILLMLIVLLPVKLMAQECTDKQLADLKKIASNINYSYEYYLDSNNMYFDITIANVYNNIYILDTQTNKKYTTQEFTIKRKKDAQTLKFEIYSKTCNTLLTTKTIVLPAYNKYYGSSYCEGISEYKYCSKWNKYNLTEKEFEKLIAEYKKEILNPTIEEKNITYKTEIRGFYVFIILILLILIMLLIAIFRKKREKDII